MITVVQNKMKAAVEQSNFIPNSSNEKADTSNKPKWNLL